MESQDHPLSEWEEATGRRLTPMLRQYLAAKSAHPEALLMFRMGDFFEFFFEDAQVAARELDLTLTARGDKSDSSLPIPMAGVPCHAVSSYIARLVERGYSVALCDQVEDARYAKGLVKREITRLITPGTVCDLEALDPGFSNYLACVEAVEPQARSLENFTESSKENSKESTEAPASLLATPHGAAPRYGVALLDVLSGEMLCTEVDNACLADELRRMGVREVLAPEALVCHIRAVLGDTRMSVRAISFQQRINDPQAIPSRFAERWGYPFQDRLQSLEPGVERALQRAVACLVAFAESTQRRPLKHIMAPRLYWVTDYLVIDETTRRNLELCATQLEGRRQGSVLWLLNRCQTGMGSRLLGQWLLFPLRKKAAIEARLDAVGLLKTHRDLRQDVQKSLGNIRDIERLVGRLAVGRATPRDLGALAGSLGQIPKLKALLGRTSAPLGQRWDRLDGVSDVQEMLAGALVDEPPVSCTEGGIFRRGYCGELDELITLATEGHRYVAELEARERKRTGISSLKVRYNKVFGYYLEVTNANLGQVPSDYIRKQTLVGAERFITEELKAFEDKVLSADESRRQKESLLFDQLLQKAVAFGDRLRNVSRLVAETDAIASLAQVADEGRYVRPTLCQEPVISLVGSRHPVLERLIPAGERFVPNDLSLHAGSRQLMVLTGPNMAGKSTLMRQMALCLLMAHMGSFVPAEQARMGLCDRLFTRVGAADNLSRGQSTFMVEMLETAAILRHATASSVVLLDEIGRGTSTFDGVSIAWAVAEYIHDTLACRAVFATHYHELTDLARQKPRIVNACMAVKESQDSVVFLRHLEEGAANRSYGIQVAKLAGLPPGILDRAREILTNLEQGELDAEGMPVLARSHARTSHANASHSHAQQSLFLFTSGPASPRQVDAQPSSEGLSALERALHALEPLDMTPLEALVALDRLKKMVGAQPTQAPC